MINCKSPCLALRRDEIASNRIDVSLVVSLLFKHKNRFGRQIENLKKRNEMRMFVRQLENAQFVHGVLNVAFFDDLGGENLFGRVFFHAFFHRGKSAAENENDRKERKGKSTRRTDKDLR